MHRNKNKKSLFKEYLQVQKWLHGSRWRYSFLWTITPNSKNHKFSIIFSLLVNDYDLSSLIVSIETQSLFVYSCLTYKIKSMISLTYFLWNSLWSSPIWKCETRGGSLMTSFGALSVYFGYFKRLCCVCNDSRPCVLCDFAFRYYCVCRWCLSQLGRVIVCEDGEVIHRVSCRGKRTAGRKGIQPAAEERPDTPLCDSVCVWAHMRMCHAARILVLICTWLDTL